MKITVFKGVSDDFTERSIWNKKCNIVRSWIQSRLRRVRETGTGERAVWNRFVSGTLAVQTCQLKLLAYVPPMRCQIWSGSRWRRARDALKRNARAAPLLFAYYARGRAVPSSSTEEYAIVRHWFGVCYRRGGVELNIERVCLLTY